LTEEWRKIHSKECDISHLLTQQYSSHLPEYFEQNELPNSWSEVLLDFELPRNWRWVRFGSLLASFRSGSTAVPVNEKTKFPILRSSSVRPGVVDLEDVKYLSANQSNNQDNFVKVGDLLFTRLSGSLDYVANAAIVRSDMDISIQYPDRLFRARLWASELTEYSEVWFNSLWMRRIIRNSAKSSAGHQRISMNTIEDAFIPLPPLEEQREVLLKVSATFSRFGKLEAALMSGLKHTESTIEALLSKAFSGSLVSQDPTDEPASALLERINSAAHQMNGTPRAKSGKRGRKSKEKQGKHEDRTSVAETTV
jgi:type I restriction enzyme S subunit